MSFCPQCGAKLEEGAAFCAQCGTAINNSNAGAGAAFDAGEDGFTPVREEPNPQPQQEETNMTRRWQQQHQQERQRNAGAAGSQQNQAQRPPRQPRVDDSAQYQVLERPILNRGQTAIVGYLGWIGFLIAMIGGDRKDDYAKSHLNQALLMNIVFTCGAILYGISLGVVSAGAVMSAYSYAVYGRGSGAFGFGVFLLILALAALIFTTVMWFFGLIRACRGNNKPVKIFGNFHPMK